MTTDLPPQPLRAPLADCLLAAADDKLMLGHRNADWTGLAPMLEEDIAFSSLAQDDLAHAQALYELAAMLLGESADHLAYGRSVEAFRCATIVEGPDAFDWATAIARLFLCNHHNLLRFGDFTRSNWPPLAALAARLAAEQQVSMEHVDDWIVRLGRGTDESRTRMVTALERLVPMSGGLFEATADEAAVIEAGLLPAPARAIFDTWSDRVGAVAERAGLSLGPVHVDADTPGGRRGVHTSDLAETLNEMTEVYRTEPGVPW